MNKIVCTNSEDFYNYLQGKGCKAVLYFRPIDGLLNIFFPETHNITICGNRYNQQRIESGEMKREFEELKKLIETPNTIVITPITLFNGCLHNQIYPNSMSDVRRQRIHTAQLGEVVYGHYIHIYNTELKPTTKEPPKRMYVEYGKQGKKQDEIYYNVWYKKCSKEERRKKRRIPQFALYKQLYGQVIKRGEIDG